MTKKVFWQDPYLTELDTTVQSVNENCITLHETIFYAFSAGHHAVERILKQLEKLARLD